LDLQILYLWHEPRVKLAWGTILLRLLEGNFLDRLFANNKGFFARLLLLREQTIFLGLEWFALHYAYWLLKADW
jgi:hypothetical protein